MILTSDRSIPPSLPIQDKINELRQKFERDYATSHNPAFAAAVRKMFAELARLVKTVSGREPTSDFQNLKDANQLVTAFLKQNQELYSKDFEEALTVVKEALERYQAFFEFLVLMSSAQDNANRALQYRQEIKAYKILTELVNESWFAFDLETRQLIDELSRRLPHNKGFDIKCDSWEELKLRFKFLLPSIRSGGADLFAEYKETLTALIHSVEKVVSEDTELKLQYIEERRWEKEEKALEQLIESMDEWLDDESGYDEEVYPLIDTALKNETVSI